MFRASKHDSTFQKTRFDIFLKETKKIPMQVNSKQLAQVRLTPEGS